MFWITPPLIEYVAPVFVTASYLSLSTYRDPIRCGLCKHMIDCPYYVYTGYDGRMSKEENAERQAKLDAPPKVRDRRYYIYRAAIAGLLAASVVGAVVYVCYVIREAIRRHAKCHCKHRKDACALGAIRYVPPRGREHYVFRDGRYHHPQGGESVLPEIAPPSSAKVLERETAVFERRKMAKKMQNTLTGR